MGFLSSVGNALGGVPHRCNELLALGMRQDRRLALEDAFDRASRHLVDHFGPVVVETRDHEIRREARVESGWKDLDDIDGRVHQLTPKRRSEEVETGLAARIDRVRFEWEERSRGTHVRDGRRALFRG